MPRLSRRNGMGSRSVVIGLWLLAAPAAAVRANDTEGLTASNENRLWRQTVDFVARGEFQDAAETIEKVHTGGPLAEQVRDWLAGYQAKQAARKELNRADFEKYVGYAKARIERKEYALALGWASAAVDCAADRDAFLDGDWLHALVDDALAAADGYRQDRKWPKAWHIYAQLADLFEHEPRYEKLQRDVLTHLRLESMFRPESHWEERIEKVRWRDAKTALENLDLYYIEPVDFKAVAASGLEQLLLLTESKAAQEQFGGLADQNDRNDFALRIRERLDQIGAAPTLDRDGCVKHYRRVLEINEETVRLPEELIVHELMRGALDPLDDFTDVIWPVESKEFDKHTRGDFVGVGISIIKNRAGEVEVVSPLEDSPAYRAGVQAGDIIMAVDGEAIKDLSLNKVVDIITGREGTPVTLTIRRSGKEMGFPLERANIKIQSVKGIRRDPDHEEQWDYWLDREHGIGYVRVVSFQRNTVEDVDNALSNLPGLKGLVLDLRGNPGGLLDAAGELSTRFLKRGNVVVSTKGRVPSENRVFDTSVNGPYSDIPLVVLVDERSASASEIVSGAIRDNHRGVVIGERTFGKFSVQNLIPLSRSSGAKLKITTAGYYLPSGASFHRDPSSDEWGVAPDISVRLVRKEAWKVYEIWRDTNLLGPPKPTAEESKTEGAGENKTAGPGLGEAAPAAGEAGDAVKDRAGGVTPVEDLEGPPEEVSAVDGEAQEDSDENKDLPPIEQPDENDRPKEDPQLDTALLFMRITLIGKSYPTLATADVDRPVKEAQP